MILQATVTKPSGYRDRFGANFVGFINIFNLIS